MNATRMNPKEYERRLLSFLSRVLEAGNYGEADQSEALELFGDETWVTQDLLPRLISPPLLCTTCGGTFRSALRGTRHEPADCYPCREKEWRAQERRQVEAEVRAQMAASGEF